MTDATTILEILEEIFETLEEIIEILIDELDWTDEDREEKTDH